MSGSALAATSLGRPFPIVPVDGGAGRSLVAVIAILAFLAALAAGAAQIVAASSAAWRSSLAREATIQVQPVAGHDLEADVARAVELARAAPGVAGVRPIPKAEAQRLLEPWLGAGLDLADLPVPRLIVLRLDAGGLQDAAGLQGMLRQTIPGASLDDHSAWSTRLSRMADAIVAGAWVLVALVLVASGGAVAFATRGAIAGHHDVVEVLHFVGAGDGYVARLFAWRFARLGLRGGVLGAAVAAGLVALLAGLSAPPASDAAGGQTAVLFGSFALGWSGYGAMAFVALADGVIAGAVTALSVKRFLKTAY